MKEAASSLSLSLSLEFQARANSFWSSQSRQSREERRAGHSVYRTRCLPFDVYKLPTAGTANAKAYALYECVCVCAYLLGAILNVHMFKATWHTARLALLPHPPPPSCQNKYKTCGTYICQSASASESHCMNVWMNECVSEWMSECQMPLLVSFACCFLGAHA